MVKLHGSKDNVKNHFINDNMYELLMSVTEDSSPCMVKEIFNEFIHEREKLIKKEILKLTE
jgi:hypothetical protein